ncbi:MAG TPA: glycosyltransferase family 4 protein, partial [Solirubrobacteraceae bacterium]|nr:glycosyltransferase family 4 protein [Solirubrobacteraceae bacterium]
IFMEDVAIHGADRLLAASHSIAALTTERTGIPAEQIDVVHGAVDTDVFSPAGEPRVERAGEQLLFVGNVVANKGIWAVLDAFLRLAPERPDLSLVLAGSADEAIGREVRARAAQAGLGERVRLLGFVEHAELPDLYRSSDVLVVPSHYEGGLGMAYLEAMACELPVIGAAAGGAAEAIVPEETGILLSSSDAEEAAAAIARLLDDSEMRARMGAAGRARVLERFGVESYGVRVAECYARAIERRRASVVVW